MPRKLSGSEVRSFFKTAGNSASRKEQSLDEVASTAEQTTGTESIRRRSLRSRGNAANKRTPDEDATNDGESSDVQSRSKKQRVKEERTPQEKSSPAGEGSRPQGNSKIRKQKAAAPAESKQLKKRGKGVSSAPSAVHVDVKVKKSSASQKCAFLLAHGAGGKSDSPGMARYSDMLLEHGDVVTFDYPGVRLDSYTPIHLSAAKQAAEMYPQRPLYLAGNSMGCRGAVNVVNSLAGDNVLGSTLPTLAGLIFFSYPLIKLPHPPVSDAQRREREPPLRELPGSMRCLFLAGTQDTFLNKDTQALQRLASEHDSAVRLEEQMAAAGEVHVVEGGNHGLKGKSQAELDAGIQSAIHKFVA